MKSILILALTLLAQNVLADGVSSAQVISKILASPSVQQKLSDRSISALTVSQEKSEDGSIELRLSLTLSEPGLGLNGPSTHPCYSTVTTKVKGNKMSKPAVDIVCAMNSPKF